MAKNSKIEALYKHLIESRFNFVGIGEHPLSRIYSAVRRRHRQLCDDGYLCGQNCTEGHANEPEWKHTIRNALHNLNKRGLLRPGRHRGTWILAPGKGEKKFAATAPALDASAIEGLRTEVVAYARGRSRSLREHALAKANGICAVCAVDFSKLLDGKGVRALQAHHKKQLGASDKPRLTKLHDIAVVCATCHSLIHLDPRKSMSIGRLRRLLQQEGPNLLRQRTENLIR